MRFDRKQTEEQPNGLGRGSPGLVQIKDSRPDRSGVWVNPCPGTRSSQWKTQRNRRKAHHSGFLPLFHQDEMLLLPGRFSRSPRKQISPSVEQRMDQGFHGQPISSLGQAIIRHRHIELPVRRRPPSLSPNSAYLGYSPATTPSGRPPHTGAQGKDSCGDTYLVAPREAGATFLVSLDPDGGTQ